MAVERLNPDDVAAWAWHSADHVARYLFASDYVRGRVVLDAGTGPGYGAAILKAFGAREVVAIDCDQGTVEEARKRYAHPGLAYSVGNAETLDGLGPIDVICSFENIEHLQNPDRFVENAARILSPGGVLLCSTPDRLATPPFVDGRPANPFHVHEWYAGDFTALLAHGFQSVELRAQVRGYGLALREEGASAVRRTLALHHDACRASFTARLERLFRRSDRLAAAQETVAQAGRLAAGSPGDYPVVPAAVAGLFGYPFCHLAICTRPRR